MFDKNYFFGFGSFEHCQDSFLGWLFNGYDSHEDCVKEFAIRLARLFCDLGESFKVDQITFNAGSQITYRWKRKKSIIDLVMEVVVNGDTHMVFIEDKTKPDFRESQLTKMRDIVENHYLNKEVNLARRHYVYFNTADMSDIVMHEKGIDSFIKRQIIQKEFIVVLRPQLINLFNSIDLPQTSKRVDSIFYQYYCYIKSNQKFYSGIDAMRSETVFEMIRSIVSDSIFGNGLQLSYRLPDVDKYWPGDKKHCDKISVSDKNNGCGIELLFCF